MARQSPAPAKKTGRAARGDLLRKRKPFSPLAILVAALFGGTAFLVASAGFTVAIPGTPVVGDPRGLLVVLGSALTGPFGGLIVGALAGIAEPTGPAPALFAYVVGGLWLGFSYRRIICDHLQMPAALVVWAAFVFAYYYVFLIPGFMLAGLVVGALGVGAASALSPVAEYLTLASGALPEATLTAIITTAVLAALPRRYRGPLW